MCTNIHTFNITALSTLSAEPHVLVLYKRCGKTAEAAGCDPETPPEGICRVKLNKVDHNDADKCLTTAAI